MQEKKEKDKPKERVREWREARKWDRGGRDRERRKLREGENEGGRMEGKMGEGRKEKGKKERKRGRKEEK